MNTTGVLYVVLANKNYITVMTLSYIIKISLTLKSMKVYMYPNKINHVKKF